MLYNDDNGGLAKMKDAMLDKLKQKDISKDKEQTSKRVNEIWKSADKKSKSKLLKFTGNGIYGTISKSIKNGRITARTTILLSSYLDINPLYLIGEADERGSYTDDFLKDFLIKLGYKKLWNEYSRLSNFDNKTSNESTNKKDEITENITNTSALYEEEKTQITEQSNIADVNETPNTSSEKLDIINNLTEQKTQTAEQPNIADVNKDSDIPSEDLDIIDDLSEEEKTQTVEQPNIADVDKDSDISSEDFDIINNLSEEEVITLIKALFIRSKLKNTNIKQITTQIKQLLMLN